MSPPARSIHTYQPLYNLPLWREDIASFLCSTAYPSSGIASAMAAISDPPPPRTIRPLPVPRTGMKYSVPPPPTSDLHAEELLIGAQNCATHIPPSPATHIPPSPSIHGSSACAKNHSVQVFPTTVTPVFNLSSSVTGFLGPPPPTMTSAASELLL